MSKFEQRDNSGTVFANDRKEKDTHPDRTGSAMIDGIEYWISGWVRKDRNGKQFLSLAFKRKDQAQPQRSLASKGRPEGNADLDDQIPF